MTVDNQLEHQLRTALHDGEANLSPAHDLAEVAATRGRREIRRRRSVWATGSATLAAAAVVSALTLLPGTQATHPSDPPILDNPSGGTRTPGLAAWVEALPDGASPDVPFLDGMTLHQPNAAPVTMPGEDAVIVGLTVRGPVMLIEEISEGVFDSRYLVVDPDSGDYIEVPTGPASGRVQDEVSSPDGRYFAAGRQLVDMETLTRGATLPSDAAVLLSWTGAGLQYADAAGKEWLWEPGERPWPLDVHVWFPSRLDPVDVGDENDAVGLATTRRCTEVVHVYRGTAYAERWGRRCEGPDVVTASPEGTWLLTRNLGVVDTAQETIRDLTKSQVTIPSDTPAYWVSDTTVLLALPPGVVRCDVITLACERATQSRAELPTAGG
jgi:hypothetical protein